MLSMHRQVKTVVLSAALVRVSIGSSYHRNFGSALSLALSRSFSVVSVCRANESTPPPVLRMYGGGGAQSHPSAPLTSCNTFSLRQVAQKHARRQPITMVTAYDYSSAQIAQAAGVDMVLVGDSVGMVVLGHASTKPVSLRDMIHHSNAVARGLQSVQSLTVADADAADEEQIQRRPMLVVDMPFGTYATVADCVANARQLMSVKGVDAIKLEGGVSVVPQITALVAQGIPVVGHCGLLPQTATKMKRQGATSQAALLIDQDAQALAKAGCFLVVLECVVAPLATHISSLLPVPTIGIGSGVGCGGQVLVWHDMLGLYDQLRPKFSKQYSDLRSHSIQALKQYVDEVERRSFPDEITHGFAMKQTSFEKYLALREEKQPLLPTSSSHQQRQLRDTSVAPVIPLVHSSGRSLVVVMGAGAMGSLLSSCLVEPLATRFTSSSSPSSSSPAALTSPVAAVVLVSQGMHEHLRAIASNGARIARSIVPGLVTTELPSSSSTTASAVPSVAVFSPRPLHATSLHNLLSVSSPLLPALVRAVTEGEKGGEKDSPLHLTFVLTGKGKNATTQAVQSIVQTLLQQVGPALLETQNNKQDKNPDNVSRGKRSVTVDLVSLHNGVGYVSLIARAWQDALSLFPSPSPSSSSPSTDINLFSAVTYNASKFDQDGAQGHVIITGLGPTYFKWEKSLAPPSAFLSPFSPTSAAVVGEKWAANRAAETRVADIWRSGGLQGEIFSPVSDDVAPVASRCGPALALPSSFYMWRKLLVNVVVNPLCALLRIPNGLLLQGAASSAPSASSSSPGPFATTPTVMLMRAILTECLQVAGAAGIDIRQLTPQGKAICPVSSNDETTLGLVLEELCESVGRACHATRSNTSSMLADLLRLTSPSFSSCTSSPSASASSSTPSIASALPASSITTEIDFLNGYIAALGKELNIPTPVNSMLVHLLAAAAAIPSPVLPVANSRSLSSSSSSLPPLSPPSSPAPPASPIGKPLYVLPRVVRTIAELRAQVKELKQKGKSIGFVPTMGSLHAGHCSLVKQARQHCDVVIVSIFVNPTQFAPTDDLAAYPRDLQTDLLLLSQRMPSCATAPSPGAVVEEEEAKGREKGTTNVGSLDAYADIVFHPEVREMYPPVASFSATAQYPSALTQGVVCFPSLEGEGSKAFAESKSRPGFFSGVATVVLKLFSIVAPDQVFFGQKDALQCIVVKMLVRDFSLPIQVNIVPTGREPHMLAMSSRNAYLSAEQRKKAAVLYQCLSLLRDTIQSALAAGKPSLTVGECREIGIACLRTEPAVNSIDYVDLAGFEDGRSLPHDYNVLQLYKSPPSVASSSASPSASTAAGSSTPLLISLAVRVGSTRLIDNIVM